jgi:hypothetical protein
MNSKKFEDFMFALKELCELHEVDISTDVHCKIQIAELENGVYPFSQDRFEDLTEPDYPFDNLD